MKNPVTWFGMLFAFSLMLVIGNASFSSPVLAEDSGASSPTIQEEPGAPPDQGGIQERGIRQMPIGGISGGAIGGRLEAVGFSCDAATKTCTCRKSKVGDCDLMKAITCKGETFNCRGSSQTCTCAALR